MKTNGCMLRVHQSERYTGPPSILSLCACDSDFSLGASQQPSTHAIFSLEAHGSSSQGGSPMRIRPKSSCFAQRQLNPCFQSNLASPCVSCCAQSIARTQFNQMVWVAQPAESNFIRSSFARNLRFRNPGPIECNPARLSQPGFCSVLNVNPVCVCARGLW